MNVLKKWMAGIVLLGLLSGSALAQSRIATVDLSKLFDNYWKTKAAKDALKVRSDEMDKSLKDMKDEWQHARDDYQKLTMDASEPAISGTERDRRKGLAESKLKDIKEKEDNIVRYQRQRDATLDEESRRMREGLLKDIREAINAKAKIGGFALVIDASGRGVSDTPFILYNAGENDITDQALTQLNSAAPSDSKPADKK
jgi:outer membrane protein